MAKITTTEEPPAPETNGVAVLKRHELELAVKLNADEQLNRGRSLAAAMGEENDIVIRHEHQKRQMKAELAEVASKIARLRTIVSSGSELRMVEVEDRADYARGVWIRVRKDTGEEIASRKLTPEEGQVPMAGVVS